MTPYERFNHRIKGEPVDRPPNFDIMMTFAAHFIHEPLSRYYLDYRVLCSSNLAVLDAFDLDIVQAISDPYREAADLGLDVEFPDDGLPIARMPLIAEHEDLARLVQVAPANGRRMSDRLESLRMFREQVGSRVPIMGWVEGALAESADLRGVSNLLVDLYDSPEWVSELLGKCVEVEIAFARAQIEAGADIIGLGDAIASQVSPAMYREFALPYEQRIFDAVREMGGIARLHICGNTTRHVPAMGESNADIIDLDWMVDLNTARQTLGDAVPLCGNFDPVAIMLQGTTEQVERAVRDCVSAAGPRGINRAGCEIPAATPHANLWAQARALAEYQVSN